MNRKDECATLGRNFLKISTEPLLLVQRDVIIDCNESAASKLGSLKGELIGTCIQDILEFKEKKNNNETLLLPRRVGPDNLLHDARIVWNRGRTESRFERFSIAEAGNEETYVINLQSSYDADSRYESIFQGSSIGHLTISKRGIIQNANQSAADILGYEIEDLRKRHFDSLVKSPVNENANVASQIVGEVVQGKKIHDLEIELVNSDTESIWVSLAALLSNPNKESSLEILIRDISARKEAEERERIARREANLWTEVMTHDLNNVNQSILFSIGYALEMASFPPVVEKRLEEARWEIRRGARMIANLRKLTQLRSYDKKRELIRLKPFIEEVVSDVKDEIPYKQIEISYEGDLKNANVLGSEHLRNVFYNVIENSVVHNPNSPTIITIRRPEIDSRDKVRIEIEDNGPGIPDKLKSTVFNRTGSPENQEVGRGLGLTLVDAIVRALDGRVWIEDRVEGQPSLGTKVVIILDRWQEDTTLECGRASCISFYKSDHCLFCDPSLDILKNVMNQYGIANSALEIINIDDPSVQVDENELPMLPVTKICDNEIAGLVNVADVRQAMMDLMMQDCDTIA